MAIAVTPSAGYHAETKSAQPSLFRRILDSMMKAREIQAKRYVNGFLVTLDDKTLADLGYKREDLKAEGSASFPY